MARRRRRLWIALIGAVGVIVVVLLLLIGTGVLDLTSSKKGTITVTGVEWALVQGTTTSGTGWFGPSPVYQNSSGGFGYPTTVGSGGSFQVRLSIYNHDDIDHSVSRIEVPSGWSVLSVTPGYGVPIGRSDQSSVVVQLAAPTTSSDESVYLVVQVFTQ
jgi:hypothetical protein